MAATRGDARALERSPRLIPFAAEGQSRRLYGESRRRDFLTRDSPIGGSMGVGLLCSDCGRFIAASEIAWFRVDGRCVCSACAEKDLAAPPAIARKADRHA